jgi:hypothetical protein
MEREFKSTAILSDENVSELQLFIERIERLLPISVSHL